MALKIRRTANREGEDIARVLHSRGPFVTESPVYDGGVRMVMIELFATYLVVRQAGRRNAMQVPYGKLYDLAARMAAEDLRRQRAADRQARRRDKLATAGAGRGRL